MTPAASGRWRPWESSRPGTPSARRSGRSAGRACRSRPGPARRARAPSTSISARNSRASSGSISASSDSILASRKIASAGATRARSRSFRSSSASSSESQLNTYRNGLAVSRNSSRSGPRSSPAAKTVRPLVQHVLGLLTAATAGTFALLIRASFSSRGSTRSMVCRSAKINSVEIVSMSLGGFDRAVHVADVGVVEHPGHLADRVRLADVGQERVAHPLALAGAADDAGDVDEAHRGRHHPLGVEELGQDGQPRIGHADHADVGLDGRERVVRRQHVVAGQGVEEGRLARVGQSDDADGESHGGPA